MDEPKYLVPDDKIKATKGAARVLGLDGLRAAATFCVRERSLRNPHDEYFVIWLHDERHNEEIIVEAVYGGEVHVGLKSECDSDINDVRWKSPTPWEGN